MKTSNALAFDRACAVVTFALDRASENRTVDKDGHLHVRESIVSRADVSPYLGTEIPGADALGLDPKRIYQLFRDPEELEAGTPSLHGKPLLFIHKPIDADDHPFEEVIGAVFNPVFDNGDVKAELVVWPGKARDKIENETQRDLSCGYEYTPIMESGTFEGQRFEGRMTKIRFNHCALVVEGRVKGAIVGDAAINLHKEQPMKIKLTRKGALLQGALIAHLAPKLAQDAKYDLAPVLAKITAKNFKASKPAIIDGVTKALTGKLAQDADMGDLANLLDAFADVDPAEDAEVDPNAKDDDLDAMDGEGLSDEEEAQYQAFAKRRKPGAADADESDEDKKAREAKEADAKKAMDAEKEEKKDMVTMHAMDAALVAERKSIIKQMQDATEAREFVRPHVGNLAIGLDSAEAVLRSAAEVLAIPSAKTVHASALRDLISMKVESAKPVRETARVAMDSAAKTGLDAMFPDLKRIGHA